MDRRYYDEEMRYLLEAGQAFAEEHPEAAQYLNIDSITDRDPYVERLFEGFAFLTGRIREQLDDELPQYTEGLLSLIAPQFLLPLPSCAIVEVAAKPGLVQEVTRLPRGTEVRSVPVGDDYTTCRYQTTQALTLQPLHLRDAALEWTADQRSRVRLRFELERGADLDSLDLSRLRLYFHADPSTASTLHLFFTRRVARVAAGPVGTAPEAMATLPGGQQWVTPAGFGDDEALLPPSPHIFSGYRLLQEYLCFPRKFWFADLQGLDRLALDADLSAFDVSITFDAPYPEDRRFGADNVRLYCAPVVNLFEADAEPIRVEGYASEYRVLPSLRHRKSMEVYDVQKVTGIEDATGKRHAYENFYQFRHLGGPPERRHYTATRRPGNEGRHDVYLALSIPEQKAQDTLVPETISIDLRVTNGNIPHEKLQEGMINQLAPDVPQIARPENLTKPTRRLAPPIERERDFFWKLISHWSLNYLSVATREALIGLLDLYDWTDGDARRRRNQRRLAGIEEVAWAPKEQLFRGGIIRGAEVTLRIRDGNFSDEGDLCLFGLVMSEFLSMYATINGFVHLTIETIPSGKRYAWTPQRGIRPIL